MAQRKESRVVRAQGKHPMEAHYQEALTKARYNTNIFNSMEEQSRYLSYFSDRKIWVGKSIDFLILHGLSLTKRFDVMMWIPLLTLCTLVYTTLVRLLLQSKVFLNMSHDIY